MSVLEPCDAAPHPGLALGSDALRLALASTESWVTWSVCRAFRDRCPPAGESTMSSAVRSVVRLQLAIACGLPTDELCAAIAYHGHVEVLEWAVGAGFSTTWLCDWAAQGGHVPVMRWARAHGHQTSDATAGFAAAHLEMLQWLRADGCAWNASIVIGRAVARGNHAAVQWAETLDEPLRGLCQAAAWGGQLETLQWLRARGYDWDRTVACAVERGHVAVAEWAVAHGAPVGHLWTNGRGGVPMYELLDRIGYDWTQFFGTNCLPPADLEWLVARGGRPLLESDHMADQSLETLAWLETRGAAPTAAKFEAAAVAGRVDIVEWLDARGCPYDRDQCIAAVLSYTRPWKCTREQLSFVPDQMCFFEGAARRGRRDVLRWLRRF
jgi:hypothetical protein